MSSRVFVVLLAWYLTLSLATFIVYARDKVAARRQVWRTPERTLHLLALLGGWPGAWYAQRRLRHKSSKSSFRAVFRVTLVINLAALGYLFSPYGAGLMTALDDLTVQALHMVRTYRF